MFGWGWPLAAGAHGIEPLGGKRYRRFKANVALPLGVVIVDVSATFAVPEAEAIQPDGSCIGTVAAIILAENAEMVQVFVAPIKEGWSMRWSWASVVSLRTGSLHQMGADASQDDTQLIDVGMRLVWFHERAYDARPSASGTPEFSSLVAREAIERVEQNKRLYMRSDELGRIAGPWTRLNDSWGSGTSRASRAPERFSLLLDSGVCAHVVRSTIVQAMAKRSSHHEDSASLTRRSCWLPWWCCKCICSHVTGHMWDASSPQPVLAGLMRL